MGKRFGDLALKLGLVAPRQLQRALLRQAERKSQGVLRRIGEILVDMGLLTPDQSEAVVQAQRQAGSSPAEPLSSALTQVSDRPAGKGAGAIPGYRIERELGAGGMGQVFLARQLSLDRPVALKILAPELAADHEFVLRFFSEARAAGRLDHPNIVRAFDVGEDKGRHYFAMEYVEGASLDTVLRNEGPFSERRALDIARQVTKGLRHAHEKGLIHRDIKPSNIILTSDGTVKILDFGLAREIDSDVRLTQSDGVHSSPTYASPEQSKGERRLDHRTDMYSLGVTLFELLTGRPPFTGPSPSALFVKHVTEAPPSPLTLRPGLSPAVSQFVLRLLNKEPRARFENYGELLRAIDSVEGNPIPTPQQNRLGNHCAPSAKGEG